MQARVTKRFFDGSGMKEVGDIIEWRDGLKTHLEPIEPAAPEKESEIKTEQKPIEPAAPEKESEIKTEQKPIEPAAPEKSVKKPRVRAISKTAQNK